MRQTLLDIYPRSDHAHVASAIFGLHMPVWSLLIAVALIGACAAKLAVLGDDAHMRGVNPVTISAVRRAGRALGADVTALAVVNLGSVVAQ